MFATKREWLGPEVLRLIEMYKKEPELWNKEQSRSCSKADKESAMRRIAAAFDTDPSIVVRKLHNLRTQFNDEMRKMERTSNLAPQDRFVSKWAYFNPLYFLSKTKRNIQDSQESCGEDSTQFEYISIEDDSFSFVDNKDSLRPNNGLLQSTSQDYTAEHHTTTEPSYEHHEKYSPESESVRPTPQQSVPTKRHMPEQEDEFSIFSAFVASELRGLRSESSRKKLKCGIMRAILTAVEAEQAEVEDHRHS